MREVYVPLIHRPGEAQVDYFETSVLMTGVQRKVKIFLMALPYWDAFFMICFEAKKALLRLRHWTGYFGIISYA